MDPYGRILDFLDRDSERYEVYCNMKWFYTLTGPDNGVQYSELLGFWTLSSSDWGDLTFGFHKTLGIYWVVAQLAAPRVALSSIESFVFPDF
jgi:hypothetical protein